MYNCKLYLNQHWKEEPSLYYNSKRFGCKLTQSYWQGLEIKSCQSNMLEATCTKLAILMQIILCVTPTRKVTCSSKNTIALQLWTYNNSITCIF